MAAARNLGFSSFQILVADRVETTNVHRYTNFIKVGQTVLEISQFFLF